MEKFINALIDQFLLLLNIIPALLKGLVIFIVGYLLAKLLHKLILKFLKALGADRLVDRLMSIELFEKSKVQIVPSSIVAGCVYYFILIITSMAAVEAMGLKMISDLLKDLIDYIPNGVTAFFVLIIGIFVADAIKKVIVSTCRALDISAGNMIANIVFYFILLNIILIALRQAKLQTEFMEDNISIILAGVAGAFGIGYGLASRHIMGSMLSSFYSRDKFSIGDEVTIDGKRGEVVTINNTDVVLRSMNEESEYVIPYSKVSSGGVEIHTRREKGPALPPHEGKD
ncbi:MAG: mechanosensitive ion channel domain-containing protein [Bacteroidota bacterium]